MLNRSRKLICRSGKILRPNLGALPGPEEQFTLVRRKIRHSRLLALLHTRIAREPDSVSRSTSCEEKDKNPFVDVIFNTILAVILRAL